MSRFFSLVVIYLCFNSCGYANKTSKTDSLLNFSKKKKTNSTRIKAYNELTKKVFYYDTKQALIFADSALNLSKKANNTYLEGITRLNISSISYHTGKYKEGIEQASLCLKIFTSLRKEPEIAKSYNNLSLLYQAFGDYPTALDFSYLALRIAEKLNDLTQLADIHNNMGVIYYSLGMKEKSIEYFLKSLDNNIKLENQEGMSIGYLNMGTTFKERKELKKAKEFLFNSLQINKEYNQNSAIANCYLELSEVYFLSGQTDSAFVFSNRAEDIYEQQKDSSYLANVYIKRGRYYFELTAYNNALKELNNAALLLTHSSDIQKKEQLHLTLSKTYAALLDYKNAYLHFSTFNLLKDSINEYEQKKNAQEMQIRFETKQMEHEISRLQQEAELNQREFALQQDELSKNKTQQALLLFIVSLLIIMSVLLIIILINRTKLNKKLSIQNAQIIKQKEEKELLLKEIHHRVKNNLQIVNSLLRLQSNQINDKKINALFEEAQNRIITMALIHEKIYRTEDLAKIDFKEYIEALTGNLLKTYNLNKLITVEKDIEVENFGIDQLVPIGLILNEILSNTFKHAFGSILTGKIWISFRVNIEGKYQLIVGDNGKGINPSEFENPSSLGIELIKTFIEQLNGIIELNIDRGTEYKITF